MDKRRKEERKDGNKEGGKGESMVGRKDGRI